MASTVSFPRRCASPKSRTFHAPIGRDHDIGALEVAMNDLPILGMGQDVRDLYAQARRGLGRQFCVARQRVQGLSLHQ
jgi:hypothetical protein